MSDDNQIVEVRRIPVNDGQILEVNMSQKFIDRLKQHFGLFGDQPLDDDQIRMYVWGAVNTAVSKAEQEHKDVEPNGGSADAVRQPHH